MANRKLTEKKLAQMFAAYCEKQSVRYVARKCGVSPTTVRKYRDERNWDKKRKAVSEKTEEKVIDKVAQRNAEYTKIADGAIKIFAAGLVGSLPHECSKCKQIDRVKVPKAKISAFDFNMLVKLIKEQLAPDAQHERHVVEIIYREPGDGLG